MAEAQQLMVLYTHQTLSVINEQKMLVELITMQDERLAIMPWR